MNIRTLVRCAVVAGAIALMNTSQAQDTFNPTLEERIIKPLRQELARQNEIWAQADKVAQDFDIFIDKFNLGTIAENNRKNLQLNRDELYQKALKFSELLNVKYVPLEGFNKPMTLPGEKYLVVGAHNFDVPGIDPSQMTCALENQAKFRIYVYLKDYFRPQVDTTYAFVAYGIKDNIKDKTLVAEKGYYMAVEKSAFDDTARAYSNNYRDIAGWYFFNKIIPGLGFAEDFQRLDKNIADFTSDLDKVCTREKDGGFSFREWRTGKGTKVLKCDICGADLNAGKACPNAATHPRCSTCGTELRADKTCPNASSHWVKVVKDYWPITLIAVSVIAVVVFSLRKTGGNSPSPVMAPVSTSPAAPTPVVETSSPAPSCPRCGSALENGVCPECTRPPEGPCAFFNFDEDATRVPAAFDLEIVSPAKWAGRFLDRLPTKFEMGRYSEKNLPPPGVPFCALNLKGSPDAAQCSRRYIRLSQTSDKSGFTVDLLAENDCMVAGTPLRKGENAIAKAGDEISISPDWRFKVVPRK